MTCLTASYDQQAYDDDGGLMRSRTAIYVTVAILAFIALSVAGYFYYAGKNSPEANTPPATNGTSQTTPSSNQAGSNGGATQQQTYDVSVYFSKRPESDDDPSKVFPVKRTSSNLGVGTFAVTELLKGPNETESAAGYFSTANLRSGSISNCGGKDFTLTITGGTATLKFCRTFDHRGVVADGQAESEIKATFKQFSSVQKVVILNTQNDCEFNLSGQNLCLQ